MDLNCVCCKKLSILFFLFLFASTCTYAEKGKIAFIHADIANIREKPVAAAQLVGRIQMNQKVIVQEESSGWSSIKYYGPENSDYSTFNPIVEGWISSSLVGKQMLKEKEMVDSAVKASSPEHRKQWAERLVIAIPNEDAHWKLLLKAAKEAGDTAGVIRAENHLNGKEDIYLAMCRNGTTKLLGKIDSAGEFTSYIWYDKRAYSKESNRPEPGIDKRLFNTITACNWGKYTASFAAGRLSGAQSVGDSIAYMVFGACPRDTILTSQVHVAGKRKGSGKCNIDLFRIRQELHNGTPVNQTKEDSAFVHFDRMHAESDNTRDNGSSSRVSRGYYRVVKIKPYPEMNLFEVTGQLPFPSWREPTFRFDEIVGLFNEKGVKRFPPSVAHPYPAGNYLSVAGNQW